LESLKYIYTGIDNMIASCSQKSMSDLPHKNSGLFLATSPWRADNTFKKHAVVIKNVPDHQSSNVLWGYGK
jgi:hypothetical protein